MPKGLSKRADAALNDLLSEIRSTTPDPLGADNLSHCEVVDESNDAESKQASQEITHDTEAADLFLEALGFGRQDPVILSAGGKDFWRVPRKPKDGYDWEQVTAQAANGRDWPNSCCQWQQLG